MRMETVRLGDFAKQVKRIVNIEDKVEYRTMGCRLYGKGVYLRETKLGQDMSAGRMFRVKENDLVVNRIWAQKGSAGVVPAIVSGSVVTNDFPVFEMDLKRVLPEFIGWFLRTQDFQSQCAKFSHGTSGRRRLSPSQISEIKFPLCDLRDQMRIAGNLDKALQLISDLRGKIEKSTELTKILMKARQTEMITRIARQSGIDNIIISELLVKTEQGSGMDPTYADLPYISLANVESDSGVILNCKSLSEMGIKGKVILFNEEHILYSKLRPYLNKVVVPNFKGCGTTELVVLKPDKTILDRTYLAEYMRSPLFVSKATDSSMGTRMPRTNMNWLRNQSIPLPVLKEQKRLVEHLQTYRISTAKTIESLRNFVTSIEKLMISILENVFSSNVG